MDHYSITLVGTREQRGRHSKAEGFRRLEIDRELQLAGLLDGEIATFKSAAAGVVLSTSCRQGLPKPCLFSGSAHVIGRHRILNQSPLFSGAVSTHARMRSRVWTR
jgi:hypothetical protein